MERVEEDTEGFFGESGAIVGDFDAHAGLVGVLEFSAGADLDGGLRRQRDDFILDEQVEEAAEAFLVDEHLWQVWGDLIGEGDLLLIELGLEFLAGGFDEVAELDGVFEIEGRGFGGEPEVTEHSVDVSDLAVDTFEVGAPEVRVLEVLGAEVFGLEFGGDEFEEGID